MKSNNGSIFTASVTSASINFIFFAIIYFIYFSNPLASLVDAYFKITLFTLVAVLLMGGLVIGKKAQSVKSGIASSFLASLGFFLLTFLLIALSFHWDYSFNIWLFFYGIGVDISGLSASDITPGFIIGYSLLISGIFTVITIIFNVIASILGGKKRD